MDKAMPCTILATLFGMFFVLFAAFWGFHYGSVDGDNCWVVSPFYTRENIIIRNDHIYTGLPGSDKRIGTESDDTFVTQYVLYVLAVACSVLGLVLACRLWVRMHNYQGYTGVKYRLYTTGLCGYFCCALVVNFWTSIAFTEYRCRYHNIQTEDNLRVATSGGEWAKIWFCTGNFWGGFFRVLVMELVLLWKAAMIQNEIRSSRLYRIVRIVVLAQIALFLVFLPLQVWMWKELMVGGFEGVFGKHVAVLNLGRFGAALFSLVHVASSVGLVYLFVRPLMWPDDLDKEGQTLKFGVVCRVVFLAVVAITSTFVCYINMAGGFANSYIFLVVDSIVNDVCMVLVSFSAPSEDVQLSQEAVHGEAVKPMGLGKSNDEESGQPSAAAISDQNDMSSVYVAPLQFNSAPEPSTLEPPSSDDVNTSESVQL